MSVILECGDLSPLFQGDLSPSNCAERRRGTGRSQLAPAVARACDRSRTEVRRRQVACAKAVTSHRTPNPPLRDDTESRATTIRGAHAPTRVVFRTLAENPGARKMSVVPITRRGNPRRDCPDKHRVRLPRPVRHERGEGRGEGCFARASGPTMRSASSPRPSPPFRTEERGTESPVRAARTFAKKDNIPVRAPGAAARAQPATRAGACAPHELHFRRPKAPTAWCAAAPGTTRRRTAARRTATTGSRATAGTTRVSGWPQLTRPAAARRLTRSAKFRRSRWESSGLRGLVGTPAGVGRTSPEACFSGFVPGRWPVLENLPDQTHDR